MEGWSFLYSSRVDLMCFNSSSVIQESSLGEYSFHQIRYMHTIRAPWWYKIFLILYSSLPSITVAQKTVLMFACFVLNTPNTDDL